MDSKYSGYISFLTKYRDELASYLECEGEKRRALLGHDLGRLEAMLKVQQAETMKFRSLEAKRAQLQTELGLSAVSSSQLLREVEDEAAKKQMAKLFDEMTDISMQIREQNKQSLDLAETNLKIIDLMHGSSEAESKCYGPENGRRKTYSSGDSYAETI